LYIIIIEFIFSKIKYWNWNFEINAKKTDSIYNKINTSHNKQ
jgi:hypothetical protein